MTGWLAINNCLERSAWTLWSTEIGHGVYASFWAGTVDCSGVPGQCHRARIEAESIPNSALAQAAGTSLTCIAAPVQPDPTPIIGCDMGCSPIVISFDGNYRLSGADDPVRFDIDADGSENLITWTARDSGLFFLALDRNGNSKIDDGSELFGNATQLHAAKAHNGFEALAQYDLNGDGAIDSADDIWTSLILWEDANHNGVAEVVEQLSLSRSEIVSLGMDYRWTGRRDPDGNVLKYRGTFQLAHAGKRAYYDVFFVPLN